MLYQYTSQNGLMGIVQSRTVWATHVTFLNDSSEFEHGLSIAKQIAAEIFMEDDYLGAFAWGLRHGLDQLVAADVYVACFSERQDLLSQWRGYCPNGSGVCVGFGAEALSAFCAREGYRLERCVYEHSDQVEAIRGLVASCLQRFPAPRLSRRDFEALSPQEQVNFEIDYRRTSEGENKPQADSAVAWFSGEIAKLAPLFKNHAFHEEAEWRIIVKDPKERLRYRAAASYLAPYIELPLLAGQGSKALTEVIVGPNPNQPRCEISIRMLLNSNGFENVDVKCSAVPYNNW